MHGDDTTRVTEMAFGDANVSDLNQSGGDCPFLTDGVSRLSGLCLVRSCSAHETRDSFLGSRALVGPGELKMAYAEAIATREIIARRLFQVKSRGNPERDDFRGIVTMRKGSLVP